MGGKKDGSIGDIIKKVVSGISSKGIVTEEELAGIWKESAGERASNHSWPVSLKKAVLVVNVDGSSWLYELTTRKKEILQKLEGKVKNRPIKDIRFRIGESRKVGT